MIIPPCYVTISSLWYMRRVKIWMSLVYVTGCNHWAGLTLSWWPLWMLLTLCAHSAGHCKTDTERQGPAKLGPARPVPVYPSSAPLAGCPSPDPTRLRLPIYSCEGLGPPTYKFRPATNYSGVDFVRFSASDRHQGGGGDQLRGIKIDISLATSQSWSYCEFRVWKELEAREERKHICESLR